MVESVFWARKLTKQLNFNQLSSRNVRKNWMSQDILSLKNAWGINYPCEIYTFDFAGMTDQPISHMVMSYVKIGQNKKIDIFVNAISNFCWQRFYICKELIHVLSSNQSNATVGRARIIEVITNLHDGNFKAYMQDQAYRVEIDAGLGAIELLLPKEIVEKEELAMNGIQNFSEEILNEISHRYRVPKVIVKARFTDEDIRGAFDRCYVSTFYQNAEFLPVMISKVG